MEKLQLYFIVLGTLLFTSCSSNKLLLTKMDTQYGKVKFYSEKISKYNKDIARIYAAVDSLGYRSYYKFYPDKIVRTTERSKQMIYTVSKEKLSNVYDKKLYLKFSSLDNLILQRGNRILDSLNLEKFKRSERAEAFIIEVNYYHGYPKHEKFKP
nr:hypothetical protein [uncultured Flavobacterium sp.]